MHSDRFSPTLLYYFLEVSVPQPLVLKPKDTSFRDGSGDINHAGTVIRSFYDQRASESIGKKRWPRGRDEKPIQSLQERR